MKLFSRSAAPVAAAACTCAVLAACSGGVGSGNAPNALTITQSLSTRVPLQSLRVHQCIPSTLNALLFFQDGSRGNFTSRVNWSSSNPGTLAVSNGDYPIPNNSGRFYPHGTLVPLQTGTAEITATYSTIKAVTSVSVGSLSNAQLQEDVEDIDVIPANNSFRMGIGTTQLLHLTAYLDSVQTDVSNYASWGFQNPDSSIATITGINGVAAAGELTGVGFGGPVVAQATLPLCPLVQTSINVSVLPIQALSIQPQYSGNPPLVIGNSERMMVFADFGNGPEQDISTQAELSSTNPTIVEMGSSGGLLGPGTRAYVAKAVAAGGSTIGASFKAGGVNFNAPTIVASTLTADLLEVELTGAAPSTLVPGIGICNNATSSIPTPAFVTAGTVVPAQFCALGVYGGDFVQDITPEVTWSNSAGTVGTMSQGAIDGGFFTAGSGVTGSLFITATAPSTSGTTVVANTATAAITANAP